MAEYLSSQAVPAEEQTASYYLDGTAGPGEGLEVRAGMNPLLAEKLGLELGQRVSKEQFSNLLRGVRADGVDIPGKQMHESASKVRIAYLGVTFSSHKSVGVSWALSDDPAERQAIASAVRRSANKAMSYLESIIGRARKGHGGQDGSDQAHITWVIAPHYTSRPNVDIRRKDEHGVVFTDRRATEAPGDPDLHVHFAVPNACVTDEGRVTGLDLQQMNGRVKLAGAYFHGLMATEMKALGIDTSLDHQNMGLKINAIPKWVEDRFSKRRDAGERWAKARAAEQGLDWDTLEPDHKIRLLKIGAGKTRGAKRGVRKPETPYGAPKMVDYRRQAEEAGYFHKSVLGTGPAPLPMPAHERIKVAYQASLPVADKLFRARAVLDGDVVREAAARGLIASGAEHWTDIDRVTAAMREHGIRQNGEITPLVWGKASTVKGVEKIRVTTGLHLRHETEMVDLARKAAADRSKALTIEQVDAAIARVVEANPHMDFSTGHGLKQWEMIVRLTTNGKVALGIGAAGSGKTGLMGPTIEAYRAAGREVFGIATKWRDADALADAGLDQQHRFAMDPFIKAVRSGQVTLTDNSVIVIEEIGTASAKHTLDLLRLREQSGAQIIGIGDDVQCDSIDAGAVIPLWRRALGKKQVPEIHDTIRQKAELDRTIAGLFREGNAAEAIALKREQGTALALTGSYREVIEQIADLWAERQAKGLTGVSVPTNAEAQDVSAAIRRRRRSWGELGPDLMVAQATDGQNRAEYDLPLAVGDRLRLYARTNVSFGNGRKGNIGNNGSVVEVLGVGDAGITARNIEDPEGKAGLIRWATLKSEGRRRVRLSYGDVMTINAAQGSTKKYQINAYPSGTGAVSGKQGYAADTRATDESLLVTSEVAEREDVKGHRPLGDLREITYDTIWDRVATNLARMDSKESALDFAERTTGLQEGLTRNMADGFRPTERRGPEAAAAAPQQATEAAGAAPAAVEVPPPAPRAAPGIQSSRKRPSEPPAWSKLDAEMAFGDELRAAGLRLRGLPIMDGKIQRVPVDGDRGRKQSGMYVGHLDGRPAGYLRNFKTGDVRRWRADVAPGHISPEQRARLAAEAAASRAKREAQTATERAEAAAKARGMWKAARPATDHPYLQRKGVAPHGLRVNRRGELLIPMRDVNAELHSLQRIQQDGGKLFLKGGRADGTHALIGAPADGGRLWIAEGYATAASIHELTNEPAIVAFNSGNLVAVAEAYRAKFPDAQIYIAADNDHHLPHRTPPLPNTGKEGALEAAAAVGGFVVMPEFQSGEGGTDWNDYVAAHGKEAARTALREQMDNQKKQTPTQAQRDAARASPVATGRSETKEAAQQNAIRQQQEQSRRQARRPTA